MQATLENLREKMCQETEDFLEEELASSFDPRQAYETLLRELRDGQGAEVGPPTPPRRRRTAA